MKKHLVAIAALFSVLPPGFVYAGQPEALVLSTWNIQTLATPGRKVFDTSFARGPQDYEDLKLVEKTLAADVYALQEVSSPAAAGLVFPPDKFVICTSGQWSADEKGLGPIYDPTAIKAAGVKPECHDQAGSLPDTAVTPGLPAGQPDPLLKQYTMLAVRKSSGVSVIKIEDLVGLGVAQNDAGPNGTFVVRNVRWGLDATLEKGGKEFHLLVVHMKSGCFDGYLRKDRWDAKVDTWKVEPKKDNACDVYARQLPALRGWIAARKAAGEDFIIAGDLNRRLDLELLDDKSPDLWPIVTGSETVEAGDDIALTHLPRGETTATGKACWSDQPPQERIAIDYFVLSQGMEPSDALNKIRKVLFTDVKRPDGTPIASGPADKSRLSDHCPREITFK
ncbi:hypothetical protein ELH42_37745 [Rhizobium ruizarguesonis]|uniref:endonuclease/exonuclease/phosphatase family protein n=1 Tax=Rhizobium ruizarguesonis TaxID=2081791 RepID=UPI001031AF8C|nr:endonuclease/exonuclease/phosphatase family protein [Rhizobium ruizarguesonis]TBB57023.1 hypothetical protein ELH42_37745 [Rhizobium ruizarguesonis]